MTKCKYDSNIYYHQPSKLVSDMPYDGSNQALHSNKVNKV